MGEYKSGLVTKNKILDVCKPLFYRNGIEKTTYNMICDSAEINRGLLPYHFSSKDNIAYIIYEDFLNAFERWMNESIRNSNVAYVFAASSFVFFRFIFSDRCFMRFYWQLKDSAKLYKEMIAIQYHTIKRISSECNKPISEESINTLSCMYYGLERELLRNTYNGFITEGVDTIATKDLLFVMSMIGFSTDEIEAMTAYAREESKNYEIKMTDTFEYSFISCEDSMY